MLSKKVILPLLAIAAIFVLSAFACTPQGTATPAPLSQADVDKAVADALAQQKTQALEEENKQLKEQLAQGGGQSVMLRDAAETFCSTRGGLLNYDATTGPVCANDANNTGSTTSPVVQSASTPDTTKQSCETPYIKTSLDGTTFKDVGEYLDTELGKRMTRTTRLDAVPGKAWNQELTSDELKAVETTVVHFQVCVPAGMAARIETGGLYQGSTRSDSGVTMTLTPGHYTFDLRNGAVAVWYPGQESFMAADLIRYIKESLNGNFDIKHSLANHQITADLQPTMSQYFTDLEVVPAIKPD